MPFVSINPATNEVNDRYETHDATQVDAALARAARAFDDFRRLTMAERATLLVRAAELIESEIPVIAHLMTSEMGKTFAAAKGEASKCAMTMRYFAEHAEAMLAEESIPTSGSRSGVRYEPVGPLLAIMPWNFPLWQIIRFAAPQLMVGNPIVLKHAPNVPGCAAYVENIFARAGYAPGVFTNLFIEVDAIESVIADERIRGVTLTGSERAGRSVAALAGKYLKKCVLELGGSDPFIVTASADLDRTVPMAVTARVQNNGQACIASKRYIVVRSIAEEFLTRFADAMGAVVTGDPMAAETTLGPIVSQSQVELLDAQVSSSLALGARALVGGTRPEGPGFFYPATVLVDVPGDARASCEELFGPVAVVKIVEDLDEALAVANDTPWGLGASVWAQDPDEIDRAIAGLETGMVFANAIVVSMPELPFGGAKNSGFGRELGTLGIKEFCNAKSYFVA
jgi:succinate-semialdehyde dehydrogenase/glutarate-semialdehyde dehydrogenase